MVVFSGTAVAQSLYAQTEDSLEQKRKFMLWMYAIPLVCIVCIQSIVVSCVVITGMYEEATSAVNKIEDVFSWSVSRLFFYSCFLLC